MTVHITTDLYRQSYLYQYLYWNTLCGIEIPYTKSGQIAIYFKGICITGKPTCETCILLKFGNK